MMWCCHLQNKRMGLRMQPHFCAQFRADFRADFCTKSGFTTESIEIEVKKYFQEKIGKKH